MADEPVEGNRNSTVITENIGEDTEEKLKGTVQGDSRTTMVEEPMVVTRNIGETAEEEEGDTETDEEEMEEDGGIFSNGTLMVPRLSHNGLMKPTMVISVPNAAVNPQPLPTPTIVTSGPNAAANTQPPPTPINALHTYPLAQTSPNHNTAIKFPPNQSKPPYATLIPSSNVTPSDGSNSNTRAEPNIQSMPNLEDKVAFHGPANVVGLIVLRPKRHTRNPSYLADYLLD